MSSELEKMTLAELRSQAKEMGIRSISGLKKSQLIEKITERQQEQKESTACSVVSVGRKVTMFFLKFTIIKIPGLKRD